MTVTGRAGAAGRRAADSRWLEWAARLGFVARGLIYVLIGLIALGIAFGRGGQADQGGALGQIASRGFGVVVLWLLVVGFAGLALWRLSEVAFGATGPRGHETAERLKSLARGIVYTFFCFTTLRFVLGTASSSSADSDRQSETTTTRVMTNAGGRVLVGLVGLALVAVGLYLAREAWKREFLQRMDLSGVSSGTRSLVERLGVVGGLSRGAVFVVAGLFLTLAAVRFEPSRAEGLDGTLRSFSQTALGPFLLVLVALGLIAFGVFSVCEARWRRV
jgi:hypothetical protein